MNEKNPSTELSTRTDDAAPPAFTDPGLPEHRERRGDHDPKAAKRAERQVAALFTISVVGTIVALVVYFAVRPGTTTASVRASTMSLGVAIGFALLGIGLGAVHWAKAIMSDRELVEDRHPARSDDETRAEAAKALAEGARESGVGVGRRGLLKGAAVSALALFPLAIGVPLISSMGGDWNVSTFRHTLWRKGTRLATDPDGRPIKASDMTIGSIAHVIPDVPADVRNSEQWLSDKAKAMVLLIRLDPSVLKEAPDRRSWSYQGIVAYSKVCTHVGCPVALYEQRTHHLLCPCHQSTFDVADGAKVIFGPAKRALPQLPIQVDDQGYLVAQSDFHEPVGPSFWERLK